MTTLAQVLGVLQGVKSRTERIITDAHHAAQRLPQTSGIARTYAPLDADDRVIYPPESVQVQTRIPDVIATVEKAFTELIDKVALVDVANTRAVADIVLPGGGETIATDVPATTLLFLEKKITDMATFIAKLPVLDPSEVWEVDPNDTGIFRTRPSASFRMKKVLRNHVKAEATDRHPAQVETYSEDVPVGTWTTIKFSGAITADEKRAMADRCEMLRQAVRSAREQANSVQVPDVREDLGTAVARYVFGR